MNQEFSPLTLIAVFAGVIEASALASLPFLSNDSQMIYTWFLVVFPFFLTVLFFLTLNFNSDSLFAHEKSESEQGAMRASLQSAAPRVSIGDAEDRLFNTYAPTREQDNALVYMISGPESRKSIERQFQRMLERPYTRQRRWVLYNLEHSTCIELCMSPMPTEDDMDFDTASL